jgi:hypothetical protein
MALGGNVNVNCSMRQVPQVLFLDSRPFDSKVVGHSCVTRITDLPVFVVLVNFWKPGQDSRHFRTLKACFYLTSAHSCASASSFHQSQRLCRLMPPHHVTGANHNCCIFLAIRTPAYVHAYGAFPSRMSLLSADDRLPPFPLTDC